MANKKQKDESSKDEPVVVAGIAAPHVEEPQGGSNSRPILPPSGAPDAQMVKVKHVPTGRVFAAWPVDAREMVTHPDGEHVYATLEDELSPRGAGGSGNPTPVAPEDGTAPVNVAPVAPETPPVAGPPVSAEDAKASLDDLSKAELSALAERAGIDPSGTKAELQKALQPHVQAGTVRVGGAGSVGLPRSSR